MIMPPSILRFLLLIGLGFFLGFAFEEFYAQANQKRPGGIRTFPLLAVTGALLYRLDAQHLIPMSIGLLALGGWLTCYYWQHMRETDSEGYANVGLMVPVCNVIAYLLGPVSLAEPPWVAVGATVATVLLLTAREELHGFVRHVDRSEIVNAGRFLLLTGFILPLLPDKPVTDLTAVTPTGVWLAVIAVCSISYASYLLQRYVFRKGGGLLAAVLGGFYSSTATVVVLASRARTQHLGVQQLQTGTILATAMMYLRILVIIFIFNQPLALALFPSLLALSGAGLVMAGTWHWAGRRMSRGDIAISVPANPLELGTAVIFAGALIIISIISTWAMRHYGATGIYVLAALVGVSDINPFVITIAQHGAGGSAGGVAAAAVLVATASNNIFQAAYATAYSGGRLGVFPAVALALLGLGGIGLALL